MEANEIMGKEVNKNMETQVTTLQNKIRNAEEARKAFIEERGEFLKFAEGTNTVQFLDEPVIEGKYGWNYHVILNGKRGILSLKGILESNLLLAVSKSPTRTVQVIRVGQGLDTRYSIKAVV